MKTEITKEEIKENEEFLIRMFGINNLKNTSEEDIKREILLQRLKDGIKEVKKGDVVYNFDNYNDKLESEKEHIVFGIKSNLFGGKDIIINKGNGYIAGGLDGKAVLKSDWLQYLKVLKGEKK